MPVSNTYKDENIEITSRSIKVGGQEYPLWELRSIKVKKKARFLGYIIASAIFILASSSGLMNIGKLKDIILVGLIGGAAMAIIDFISPSFLSFRNSTGKKRVLIGKRWKYLIDVSKRLKIAVKNAKRSN